MPAATAGTGRDRRQLTKARSDPARAAIALDAVNAAELRIRAQRRMGEALRDMEKNEGGRPVQTDLTGTPGVPVIPPATLEEIGITKKQSARYQAMAAIPRATFEIAVEAYKGADEPLSAAGVVRVAETLDDLPDAVRQDVVASGPAEIIAVARNHRTQGTGENEWYTPAAYVEAARAAGSRKSRTPPDRRRQTAHIGTAPALSGTPTRVRLW